MLRAVLALDIGGANLKAAHSDGQACQLPFELWRQPTRLAGALHHLIATMPAFDRLAVTMTGELCDCFESRRQGVLAILDAVDIAAGAHPVRIWGHDGFLVVPAAARVAPLQAAAANWLALATFAGRYAPRGRALLLDIGTTTTDIVPIMDGKPVPQARADLERLRCRELVYSGIRRTPLCALLGVTAAAEVFATTLDVYLVLNHIPEDATDFATADGRPATRAAAQGRLARMLCADTETCAPEAIDRLARSAQRRQVRAIQAALLHVIHMLGGPAETIVLAGSGEFLARHVLQTLPAVEAVYAPATQIVSLAQQLGPAVSQAACAYALATLAMESAHEGA